MDTQEILGRAPDRLSIEERRRLSGWWIALEAYTPATMPLKRIEAAGRDVASCVEQLSGRGLDPRVFEFVLIGQ